MCHNKLTIHEARYVLRSTFCTLIFVFQRMDSATARCGLTNESPAPIELLIGLSAT